MLETTKYTFLCFTLSVLFSCNGLVNDNSISQSNPTKVEQTFHSSGNLATETRLNAQGKRDGQYKEWFPNGKLQVEKVYNNGELQSQKLYTIDGKVIQNIVYKDGRKYGLLFSSFCINGVAKSAEKDSLIFNAKN